MFVWSPLAGGFLSGKYTRDNPKGDGGRLTGFDMLPYDKEKGYKIVDRLRAIAAEHQATPAQVAFAFARAVGMLPLTGTSSAEHMKQDLDSLQITLPTEVVRAIESIAG